MIILDWRSDFYVDIFSIDFSDKVSERPKGFGDLFADSHIETNSIKKSRLATSRHFRDLFQFQASSPRRLYSLIIAIPDTNWLRCTSSSLELPISEFWHLRIHFFKPMSLCVLYSEDIKVLAQREEKGVGDKEGNIDRLHTTSRSITSSNESAQFDKTWIITIQNSRNRQYQRGPNALITTFCQRIVVINRNSEFDLISMTIEKKANAAKKRGNDLFRKGRYNKALKEYSKAIKLMPNDHAFRQYTIHKIPIVFL